MMVFSGGADMLRSLVSAFYGRSILAVAFSMLVPIIVAAAIYYGQKKQDTAKQKQVTANKTDVAAVDPSGGSKIRRKKEEDTVDRIEHEPWYPSLEIKEWQHANQLVGCPWNFDGCEGVEDVLGCIWRSPINKALLGAFDCLKSRVKGVRVAKSSTKLDNEVHFAVIYTLQTGAELFGGSPLEYACGIDLGDSDSDGMDGGSVQPGEEAGERSGLRQRKGGGSAPKRPQSERPDLVLPVLASFFRIHDGFGVLLSQKHLPLLLSSPGDYANGSCFYVYPVRGLEPPLPKKPHLVKFARVDKSCIACGDKRKEPPTVVYVETPSCEVIDDDEELMGFIGDTVCNIAGQRVVPPSYMGGPGGFTDFSTT